MCAFVVEFQMQHSAWHNDADEATDFSNRLPRCDCVALTYECRPLHFAVAREESAVIDLYCESPRIEWLWATNHCPVCDGVNCRAYGGIQITPCVGAFTLGAIRAKTAWRARPICGRQPF